MFTDQTLHVSQAHLDIALNQLKLGFWELDLKTFKLDCTPQCKMNVGAPLEEPLSYDQLIEAIIPEDREQMQFDVDQALSGTTKQYRSHYRVKHSSGEIRWIEANGTVLYDNGEADRLIGTTRDITETKDLELLKDELLSVTTHELKTPVSAVKGYLQILHRFIEETGDQRYIQLSSRALSSTERITRLLNEIADPVHRQVNQIKLSKEQFDLRILVEEISGNAMTINPEYDISVSYQTERFTVFADRYRIGQVLTNLINNAIKYSPDNNEIFISLIKVDGSVKVKVIDHGIGLNEDEHQKIFQKFYRAKSTPKDVVGYGIGLFLCSEIVMRHGGQIGVETLENKIGTCFYFTLPV